MRTALFMLAFTPLLGGCLGPAPWADWDGGYTGTSSRTASAAPWSDWDKSAGSGAATGTLAPAEGVTYGARPVVQTLAAEPITAPPPTRTRPTSATASMGGPYAPLDVDAEASDAGPAQPLKLRGSGTVRTLPLVMTGTGKMTP